jgi:hypothetical protein
VIGGSVFVREEGALLSVPAICLDVFLRCHRCLLARGALGLYETTAEWRLRGCFREVLGN